MKPVLLHNIIYSIGLALFAGGLFLVLGWLDWNGWIPVDCLAPASYTGTWLSYFQANCAMPPLVTNIGAILFALLAGISSMTKEAQEGMVSQAEKGDSTV